ncbi:MAG: tRNA lysidine(34) synthetase TilS [Oscillospiraceae bacterium]|nr:tRNA lysidine(34) synthetase TilS [Oscillospiraceae bacterium]
MSLKGRAENFCRRAGFPLTDGVRVLCAVSGGLDSMVLLHLLWTWRQAGEISLTAATFDHQLRPQSEADARFVADWCRAHEIPCGIGTGDVAVYASEHGQTVEEAARNLRYAFLERAAEEAGADYIATAHTADDNAETVLLHLLRGSGLTGLGGIPPRRGRIIRPLLEITRKEIESYARAYDIPHREDESNRDTAYTRNYLRHEVLPLLREKNPNLAKALGRTAESLRRDEAYLTQLTEEAARRLLTAEQNAVSIGVSDLNAQPEAIALRLVQRMAELALPGTVLPHDQRQALLELARRAHPSGAVSLVSRLQGRRSYDTLTLTLPAEQTGSFAPVRLSPGEARPIPELGIVLTCRWAACPEGRTPDCLYLRPGETQALLVRPRQPGDEIDLPRRGRKKLKKWMIEEKIPRESRERLPVIEIDGQVAAVLGMGNSGRWLAWPGETALELVILRER